MSESDDLYYLQPGYDLNSLTVAKLRGILVAHDIDYPSSAKKVDLIEVVRDELLPQARKLLRDRDRVRRTSAGITNVPSSQESLDEDEMPPPAKTPRSRKSRTILQDDVEPTPKPRRSKTPTSRRTRTPRYSDAEITEPEIETRRPRRSTPAAEPEPEIQSVRRTRKSTPAQELITPGVRVLEPTRRSMEPNDSPFSQDNPFQQGSSPPETKTDRSRRSMGNASASKSSSRRKTRSPTLVKSEEYEIPISHLSTGTDGIETTEEFTEDAKGELGQEMSNDRRIAKSRRKDVIRHSRKPTSTAAKAAPWTVLTLALAAAGAWYRQEKVAVGYCGVGQSRWSLAEVENVPTWLHDSLEPQCEPCPQHAICSPSMQVECEHDFVLNQHPLSLNGLIPIPPTCEPDSEKEKRIKIVADRAVEELRQIRATYECGDRTSSTIVSPVKLEITEDALKETIAKQRRKNMSPEEFEDLWNSALGDIQSRDEVEITQDKIGRNLLSSNSFANLPFTCAIRRSAIRTLAANRIPLLFLILSLSSVFYGRQRFIGYKSAKAQVPRLVSMTLDRLSTQAALKEDGRAQDGFLSIGQLRDMVLSNVFERKERDRVWERVKKIVENNSNVRAANREGGKTGEWARSWEWIGPTGFTAALEGRISGLISDSAEVTPVQGRENLQVRRWDEGRAMY